MISNLRPITRTTSKEMNVFVAPLLHRIKKESADEYVEMQEAFELIGWAKLPDDIKIEIYDDVRFMVKELKGLYSTCDPFIQNDVNEYIFGFKVSSIRSQLRKLLLKR